MIRIDHRFPPVAAQRPKSRDKKSSRRSAARFGVQRLDLGLMVGNALGGLAGEYLGQTLPGLSLP